MGPAVGAGAIRFFCPRAEMNAARFVVAILLGCGATIVCAQPPEKDQLPQKLLLLGQSPDGHPSTTHEYMPGAAIIAKLMEKTPRLEIRIEKADEPWSDGPKIVAESGAVVLFLSQGAKWLNSDPRRLQAFAKLAARGGGLAVLHWGMGTREAEHIEPFVRLFGGCHGGPDRRFKIVEVEAQPAAHAIASGIKPFRLREEFYYRLKFAKPAEERHQIQPVLRVPIDGEQETVAWAWDRPDGGRSFGFSGLHFHDNWKLPEYRRLVVQGILWTLKRRIPENGTDVEIDDKYLKVK
jgi:type 1 glutamine amidotransferase